MVLEATVILIDNSEWMRNGDFVPSRLEAQNDAVTFLFNAKTSTNAENTVGLIALAGKSPNVLVTLTSEIGKILTSLHHLQINGKSQINTGVSIAQLVLKHRQNKNQRQRIILFVGSPVEEDEKTLVKLGKKLKKNNVAVDIINFGQEQENEAKLAAFIEAVNSSDNSHLVYIPPGPHLISDIILSSPIIQGEDGPPPGFGGNFEFGVDPSLDPELAMALKMSMEEEKARMEKAGGGGGGGMSTQSSSAPAQPSTEDDELAAALAMSMGVDDTNVDVEMSADEEMARAIEMSMQQDDGPSTAPVPNTQLDPAFLNNMLGSLPGVDPNDPRLKNMGAKKPKDEKKDEKK